ncbi:hypothetical protein [Actibacterium sp. 188UL27-1]|uniref:hypothetical protein n=1 Tax=Actibacterium sp. 188UL27-1 TaxID=2786961 RepID=UPI00195EA522|nr:hypothetical protein [Actibacterium sp. 188UL27-1]
MIVAIGLALILKGCGAVVPSTVAKLDQFSPLTVDPAGLEVALDIPDGLDLSAGSEVLRLSAVQKLTGEHASAQFVLQRRDQIAGAPPADGRMAFYRIAPADRARMRALQARIRQMEMQDEADLDGSLGIAIEGCIRGAGPTDGARGSIWLRVEPDGQFLPLIRRGRVSTLFEDEPLERCGI